MFRRFLRRVVTRVIRFHAYQQPAAGFAGYVEVAGVLVAFVATDGSLLTEW